MSFFFTNLSLSLSFRCVFTACLSNKGNNDVNDSETIPIGILRFNSLSISSERAKESARVCIYIYICACVYITEQQSENVTIIRVLLLLFVCVRYYSSLIRDDVFCVEFWSADESFSLSLSLFLPLSGAFGIHRFSLCFFLSLSLFYSLSLSLFPFLSSQSLLVLLCRSSSLS